MVGTQYSPGLTVAQVLERNSPNVYAVFSTHKTACVGCQLAGFCTLAEVADVYDIPLDDFLAELAHAAQSNIPH
jgi:hypothetical protein